MKRELISKQYAKQILKKAYPLEPGDTISFQVSEALFVLEYSGNSYSAEVNEFIKNIKVEKSQFD